MFGGEYKSRPTVSLRGASKKEKRTSLIHRNQAEREKREELRKKNYCALKIQAFVRGYWIRRHEYDVHRQEFDVLLVRCRGNGNPEIETLHRLLRCLLFFYSERKDCERLINSCQVLLKCSKNITVHDYPRWTFQIKQFLNLCSRYLKLALQTKKSFAIPLRVLEVFTSEEWHAQLKGLGHKVDVTGVAVYLVKNGYFKHLRFLMEERIPSSLEVSTGASTPLADSIIDLITRPVQQTCTFGEDHAKTTVLCSFAEDLLVPKTSEQVKFFLLPKLQDCKRFPFKDLLSSLKTSSLLLRRATPTLLYSILILAQTYLDTLTRVNFLVYMETILHILRKLPQKVLKSENAEEINDSDEELACASFQKMDEGLEQEHDVIASCIELLNSGSHVKLLLAFTTHRSSDDQRLNEEYIKLLCLICNSLIFEQKCLITETRLLLNLSFNKSFLKRLWELITKVSLQTSMGKEIPLLQMVMQGNNLRNWEAECISPLLAVFCFLFSNLLFSLHDTDFRAQDSGSTENIPFTLAHLSNMGRTLCDTTLGVIDIMNHEIRTATVSSYRQTHKTLKSRSRNPLSENELYTKDKWNNVLETMTHVVKQLYSRDTRLHYCPPDHWLSPKVDLDVDTIDLDIFFQEEGSLDTRDVLQGTYARTFCHVAILEHIPFVIPFVDRVKLFQRILNEDKDRRVGNLHNFLMGPSVEVRIRRSSLYQDAFDELGGDQDLKQKVHVKLINLQGLEEAGVDGGGLLREFLNECLKAGYDPNIGFFSTTHKLLLYPNPQAELVDRNVLKHFYFLGKMLGKAIYENMLVELPFASFFLCKLLSKTNTDVDINYLESLDPEMYRNLLYLKDCPNVQDLALNFTVVNNNFGERQVVELKAGGGHILVTNQNRIEYIHLMADYRLNKQIRAHCNAFRSGLASVINISWLRMFDHNELQVLISGAQVPIDVQDLKNHTSYSGGLSEEHVCVQYFWEVISGFNDDQRRQLLKFVTSCSRPPLLGFKDLHPPFTIHTAGIEDRLPSASTCVNLLKLPEYKDVETMRQKLLYSIESGAGFELS